MASEHLGDPGGSAHLNAQRLREEYEALRASRSPLGRMLTALFPSAKEKRLCQEERNWLTGAEGEQGLASSLAQRCPHVPLLHDRRAPSSRANIDHIAIAPSGVYVIDCKRYRGKIEVATPLLGKPKLKINGRDRTKLIDGLDKQVATSRLRLATLLRMFPSTAASASSPPSYPLYYAKRLAKRLNQEGPITVDQAQRLKEELARCLPPAFP